MSPEITSSVGSEADRSSPLIEYGYHIYTALLDSVERFTHHGPNIYETEWDTLIILDACRFDAMRHVAEQIAWVPDIGEQTSIACNSEDWMDRTFVEDHSDEMANTVYVTGNPYAKSCISDDDFEKVEHLYDTDWSDELNAMPARPITDHAIRAGRNYDLTDHRLIVHYIQPHFPSIPALRGEISADSFEGGGLYERWRSIKSGELNKFDIYQSYIRNLKYVLEEVRLLKDNLDSERTIVTSDHGTAIGEWGVYGHGGIPFEEIKTVPWFEIETEDGGTYTPEIDQQSPEKTDIQEQLTALGYR